MEKKDIINSTIFKQATNHIIPDIITHELLDFIVEPEYKLLDWIDKDRLHISMMADNKHPAAIEYIKKNCNPDEIEYDFLADNPYAVDMLIEEPDNINWLFFFSNTNSKAIDFIENNLHLPTIKKIIPSADFDVKTINYIDWNRLSANSGAIGMLERNPHKIKWSSLCLNEKAIHIIEQNLNKICWSTLSRNSAAIHLIEQNLDKVNWLNLSSNEKACHILEQNLDKVNWINLSGNPGADAIKILEANQDKIDWYELSSNPSAIELLEQNLDKIVWSNAIHNTNPKMMDLIRDNINKIDEHMANSIYEGLAANPNIFVKDESAYMKKKLDILMSV